MSTTLYVAVDIGCIECGEESAVLGAFRTREEAQQVADAAREEQSRNWTGQHDFLVQQVELPDRDGTS